MNVCLTIHGSFTAKELATVLANATPKEFADFWFHFAEIYDQEKLDAFAKAMAPALGGLRKEPLRTLVSLINYYEINEKKRSQ